MKKAGFVWNALIAGGLACAAQSALAQEPTSAAKRAELIKTIDSLEARPYASDAEAARGDTMRWLIDAPDVSVTACSALLVNFDKLDDDSDGSALAMQLMLSEARFILEHPDQAADDHAVHTAGVEGVLRTYAAMKSEKNGLKLAPIEQLAKIKADGKLPEFVTKTTDRCN